MPTWLQTERKAACRMQAGVRGWIGRRAFYDMIAAFMEGLLRRVVMRIQAGVRGWIVRRRVA